MDVIPESQVVVLPKVVPLSEEISTETKPVLYRRGETQWPLLSPST